MRFAFAIDPNWRGPADVFLADLPRQAGDGLVFDPVTKEAKLTPPVAKDKPAQVQGEAVFAVKPEFKWLTFKAQGKVQILADGVELKLGPPADGGHFRLPIPPGSRALKIHADGAFLREAGFLTAGPKVARAVLHVPGQDSTKLVPVVYTEAGKQVGAVTLWAQPGEPWVTLFDSSADDGPFFVYPVDRKHNLVRPNWIPEAGLVLETRYLDRYDAKVKSLPGFQELWKQSEFVAGKMTQGEVWRSFLPCQPMHADLSISKMAPRGAPLTMSRYVGHVRLPADDEYRFHLQARPAGFLVVDGQTVIDLGPAEAMALLAGPNNPHKIAAVKLSAGPHRIEVYQYGAYGQFHVSLGWSTNSRKAPHLLGHDISLLEPIAYAVASPKEALQSREAGTPLVNIVWSNQVAAQQCLGQWPAEDMVAWQFASQLSVPTDGVVFRWRFDDGHQAEGASVRHVFCRTGMREVTVEAVEQKSGKVLASRTDKVHVQPRWDWPESHSFHLLVDALKSRAAEYTSVTPIEELLNVHAWACQFRRNDLREALGPAWAKRVDEVIAGTADDRLYHLGIALAEPEERRYAVAEKVLRAAVAQSPPASQQKKLAALALADLLTYIDGKAPDALDLLVQIDGERTEVDLTDGWKFAPLLDLPPHVVRTPLAKLLEKVAWQQHAKDDPKFSGKLPIRLGDKTWTSCWLTKEITLPADRPQRPLVLELGQIMSEGPGGSMASPGMIWLNGEPLGEPWRWRAGRVVAPAKMLRTGANQLVLLLESPAPIEFFPKDRGPVFAVSGPSLDVELPARWERARADILLHLGKIDEARKLLEGIRAKSWPLDEAQRLRLAAQLRSIRRLAGGAGDDPDNAIDQIDALLHDHPLLRLDAEVMVARVEAHLARKEFQRAVVLAGQMLSLKNQGETTRRQFMLAQVQAAALHGQLDNARKFYKNLTDLSPYSPETVRAREIIIRAVKGP